MPFDATEKEKQQIARAKTKMTQDGVIPGVVRDNAKARQLVAQGWRVTYSTLFGQSFVDILDSEETDDRHHSEAIEWLFTARRQLIEFELERNKLNQKISVGTIPQQKYAEQIRNLEERFMPEFWAYLAMWARANMKTSVARYATIVDAFMSWAFDVSSYALIVGGTRNKVRGSAKTISAMLQSEKIKEYAPPLSVVKKSDSGAAQGWTADFINTAANCVFHFIGLDEGVAGANIENVRPTIIVPDDIDDREDSPVISESRFNTLTRAVIPTKQWNTLFFFAQNLISRYSVLYRIWKQQAKVLTNRFPTNPVPAVRDLVTEQRTINGIIKDIVVSGKCTWRGWNLREVQNQIDSMGLSAFLVECQHEVEQSKEGLILHNYDDDVHPISYSQFAACFRSPDAWKQWYKVLFNDYARTKTKYHANVGGYLCVSPQSSPVPGHTFLIPVSFAADTEPEDMAERFLSLLTENAHTDVKWRDLINEAWKRLNAEQYFDSETEKLNYLKSYYSELIPKYSKPVLERFLVKRAAISHSEDKLRNTLNLCFGFAFEPSNPGKNEGIEDINAAFRVDKTEPHLFDRNKQGYTRFHVLCKDDKSVTPEIVTVYRRGVATQIEVYPPVPYSDALSPDDLHDDDLFRYQMLNCRRREPKLTESGEQVDEPFKANDDFKQGLQMVYVKRMLDGAPLVEFSIQRELEAMVAPALPAQTADGTFQISLQQQQDLQYRRYFAEETLKEKYGDDVFDEEGNNWWD